METEAVSIPHIRYQMADPHPQQSDGIRHRWSALILPWSWPGPLCKNKIKLTLTGSSLCHWAVAFEIRWRNGHEQLAGDSVASIVTANKMTLPDEISKLFNFFFSFFFFFFFFFHFRFQLFFLLLLLLMSFCLATMNYIISVLGPVEWRPVRTRLWK